MLKRLVVAIIGLLGIVVIALGVASATLWRADDVLVAELQADEHLVVTDPGVLELAAEEVTVRVEADGPVVLAIGRDTDVTAWVGADAHQRVTGLSGWHDLAAEDVAAPTPTADPNATPDPAASPVATPAAGEQAAAGEEAAGDGTADGAVDAPPAPTAPDPAGSDMWVAEVTGDGGAEITWTAQPGRWSVLAASTAGSPPRISLAWPQVVTTPWLWPCVVVGTLLVLLAAGLLVRDVRRGRRGADAGWTPVLTGPVPVVGGDGAPVQLTRRQLRELAAHGAVTETGVRAPRDDAAVEVGPASDAPLPVGAGAGVPPTRDGARPDDARTDADDSAAGTPASAGRGIGALAGVAATRRALRAVTSFGSSARDDRSTEAPTSAVPAAAARPGPATPERADRPAWRPTPPPPARGPVDAPRPSSVDAPRPLPVDAPRPGPARPGQGDAPAGALPGGSPRWSVGGSGGSPWTAAGTAAASPGPAARAGAPAAPGGPTTAPSGPDARPTAPQGHPAGRPAWLGRTGTPGAAGPSGGTQLPAPGAPGSPDVARRGPTSAPGPAGPAGSGSGPAAPPPVPPRPAAAPGAGSARPGWAPVPPAPGPVAGRSSGPDAERRPTAPQGVRPAGPAPHQGPDPSTDGPRPAWLRDAPVPSGPRAGASADPPGGSRADAWRRAWGLASTDDEPTSEEGR